MMQTIQISNKVIEAIISHAEKEMPFEACGYLAEKNGIIAKHYELTNVDRTNDHFSMDPEEQFAAVRDMRVNDFRMAAVYHSHPETPARPSNEDIRLAFDPDISYVIVSLSHPKPVVKSFRIRHGKMTPEEIVTIDGAFLPGLADHQ